MCVTSYLAFSPSLPSAPPHPLSTATQKHTGLFVAAALIPRLSIGLDQAVALPEDSYMQDYFRWVGGDWFEIGSF